MSDGFFYLGLICFAVGIPTGKFIMTLGSILLGVAWILRGDFKQRLKSFIKNRLAVVLCSLFLLHLIGLLWTSDFEYGLKDIRVKLPLFILPFIFATMPLPDERTIKRILWLFVATVLFTSVINLLKYYDLLPTKRSFDDPRQISTFVLHVRLSMLMSFALLFLVYEFANEKMMRVFTIVLAAWFLFYIFHTSLISALVYLLIAGSLMLLVMAFRQQSKALRVGVLSGIFSVIAVIAIILFSIVDNHYTPKEDSAILDSHSVYGEAYHHNPDKKVLENGYYLWNYFASHEFHDAWFERTGQTLHVLDGKGNSTYLTAARYLTSKGLRKDRDGVMALSEEDIRYIQSGVATIRAFDKGIKARIHAILFEIDVYRFGGNPSGHSLTQRLFHWDAAVTILANHPFGVGTGDLPKAYSDTYNEINSPLTKSSRLRAHNQYLTMGVAFGFLGLIGFILWVFVPVFMVQKKSPVYVYGFLSICILSYFWEDTLETQEGVTFVAFFSALLLLSNFAKHPKVG